MPHLETTILLPSVIPSPESVLFPIGLRAVKGRPIVCMVPMEERVRGLFMTDEVQAMHQADLGVVADPGRSDHLGNGCNDLSMGDMVVLKPYTGAWLTHRDFDWIPEGRELRILGTVDDDALDNVLAVLTP